MRVLIADDSDVVRQRLSEMLEDIENIDQIDQASSVKESLDHFHVDNPDVVILDIRMTDGSGIDVLQSIKEESPETLVIMLTNFPTSQYRRRCMSIGADFFFDKSTEYYKVRHVLEHPLPSSDVYISLLN